MDGTFPCRVPPTVDFLLKVSLLKTREKKMSARDLFSSSSRAHESGHPLPVSVASLRANACCHPRVARASLDFWPASAVEGLGRECVPKIMVSCASCGNHVTPG